MVDYYHETFKGSQKAMRHLGSRGTTTHVYNKHGEETSSTDARGVTVARTVDELDRVTEAAYPTSTLDTVYTYDTAPTSCSGTSVPIGRLASITRDSQSVDYCYDRFGRVTRDGELTYGYDDNGNRTEVVYPGEVSASYGFDFADRKATLSVTTTLGGTEPVVTAASYLPSGPLSALTLGSGSTESRAFDGRDVPTGIGLSTDPGGLGDRTWAYTTDRVGNVLEIVEMPGCAGGGSTVLLENQTVSTTETFTSCADLQAGNGFSVESPGNVTLQAQGMVILSDGFSVGNGALFTASSGGPVEFSHRTYAYQAPQYFLTLADGPWGTRDWTYDTIGNRLSESKDEGLTADTYTYLTNGSSGNTPILDAIGLAVGGTRDYTWGAAGHLAQVDAAGNVIDLTTDDAGRLSQISRKLRRRDGRVYLRRP